MEENFNIHLGKKLRMRRLSLGLTQTKVAQAINVTFQQIQKYERCINRLPGDHLIDICNQKRWDLNLFAVTQPQAIFDEWMKTINPFEDDSPYPLRISQITRAWEKIDNVGKHNYLTRQTNPRYKTMLEQMKGN